MLKKLLFLTENESFKYINMYRKNTYENHGIKFYREFNVFENYFKLFSRKFCIDYLINQ